MHSNSVYKYLLTEQILMTTSNSSAVAILSCGINETAVLHFVLESPSGRLQHINLTCGRSENLTGLARKGYVLYRRYTDQYSCQVQNFTGDLVGKFLR